jgi:protein-S-isoprenylcysteine O-methyltransferase Ste14
MIFWVVFALATIALVVLSWRVSIKAKRYHGLCRFFAFEAILALFLLNVPFWFDDPFSIPHVLSWLFLTASLILAIHGAYLLKKLGRPQGQIENTTRLIVSGVYRWIRHPLYASLGLLGLGIFLKRTTTMTAILALVDLIAVYLTALIEEKEMRVRFGEDYETYRRKTKMFVPYVF